LRPIGGGDTMAGTAAPDRRDHRGRRICRKGRLIVKGNTKVLATLNEMLVEELTAIVQYVVHSEMCANWGYDRLHKIVEARAVTEMKHAEKLIARILFLEGVPKVGVLNKVQVGSDVAKQLASDLKAETKAVKMYNDAVHLADDSDDGVTREMLEGILKDEDAHVDWLEEQHDQIEQMGIQLYLTTQTRE
jgi:bacterioferritin